MDLQDTIEEMFTIPDYSNPSVFLNDKYIFSVVHNDVFSINNMTDQELRQSIVEDILMVTMWEKENNKKLHFGFTRFLHWLPRSMYKRVIKEMKNEEISGLIDIQEREIRIKDQKEILQAAMDYCGHWWDGYDIPNQEGIFTLNKEVFEEKVNEAGGLKQLVENLANAFMADQMDEKANSSFVSTVQ